MATNREFLLALDDYVHVLRIEFNSITGSSCALGGDSIESAAAQILHGATRETGVPNTAEIESATDTCWSRSDGDASGAEAPDSVVFGAATWSQIWRTNR